MVPLHIKIKFNMDLKNSSDVLAGSGSKPKRRTRNDQNNRDFTCGCGKSYLSYPALYTHLKQKHGGKPPQGTQLPNNLGSRGARGRPRIVNIRDDENRDKEDDDKSQSSNQPEETIEEILIFLDTLGTHYRSSSKTDDRGAEYKLLVNNFPIDILSKNDDAVQILEHIKNILQIREREATKDEQEDQLPSDPIYLEEIDLSKNIKKTPVNKIFAYFLCEIGPKLSVAAYRELAVYVIFFQRALNEIGYLANNTYDPDMKVENGENNGNEIPKKKELGKYCEVENGEKMLFISNELILQLLPKYFKELGDKIERKFEIFGSADECLKNAVYVTQHFSYWLYANKFTNNRLALYTEDD